MKKIIFGCFVIACAGLFFPASAQSYKESIDTHLQQLVQSNKIGVQDKQWILSSQHTSSTSNITHAYFRQAWNGLEIHGTESSVHSMENGNVLSSHTQFLTDVGSRVSGSTSPSITPVQAVAAAAMHLSYSLREPLQLVSKNNDALHEVVISNGGISHSDIPVKLIFQRLQDNTLVLAWDLSIHAITQKEWYSIRINATTGEFINKNNWMLSCNISAPHSHEKENTFRFYEVPSDTPVPYTAAKMQQTGTYRVVAMPLESPLYGARTLEANPSNSVASPFGWHDTNGVVGAEFTVTRGNNVNAYESGDNFGFQPDGGASLVFDFPFNPVYSGGDQSESAAITNLFYWNNSIHDVLYLYGFDEASGNFQVNNYGNGGLGGDSVNANAQMGQVCNAFFGTPSDGSSPFMDMYICGNRDGCFDNLVVVHEYGHGITNRLTGGASNSDCLWNVEQMGEGWSDWYGLILTMGEEDVATYERGIGTFLFGEQIGGAGIREFPYTTDMNVNPHTYDDIKEQFGPHGIGSVWAAMLWEMTWGLIDAHGFDTDFYTGNGGNNMAIALVTEGLKLQPCSPGFVDGRDAILAADVALYGGANQCIIWDAFAKRGLGLSATQGSSESQQDGEEAFDSPAATALYTPPAPICVSEGLITNLGGGTPVGGVYSGDGVTDNGDGLTFTLDTEVVGVGVHNITYTVPATSCGPASSDTNSLEVVESLVVVCAENIVVEVPEGTLFTLPDYFEEDIFTVTANCSDETITAVQIPEPGAELGEGTYTITVTFTDAYDNEEICTFLLTVDSVLSTENNEFAANAIVLFPNPASQYVTIQNNSNTPLLSAVITDINGRKIEVIDLGGISQTMQFSIENYATGLYFVTIHSENTSIVKRLVKK